MNDLPTNKVSVPEGSNDRGGRRIFLQSMGKWSGAAIIAAVTGSWLASAPRAEAGWINRRGGGGGGSWINRGGGGGWINRRGGGGGSWINR